MSVESILNSVISGAVTIKVADSLLNNRKKSKLHKFKLNKKEFDYKLKRLI